MQAKSGNDSQKNIESTSLSNQDIQNTLDNFYKLVQEKNRDLSSLKWIIADSNNDWKIDKLDIDENSERKSLEQILLEKQKKFEIVVKLVKEFQKKDAESEQKESLEKQLQSQIVIASGILNSHNLSPLKKYGNNSELDTESDFNKSYSLFNTNKKACSKNFIEINTILTEEYEKYQINWVTEKIQDWEKLDFDMNASILQLRSNYSWGTENLRKKYSEHIGIFKDISPALVEKNKKNFQKINSSYKKFQNSTLSIKNVLLSTKQESNSIDERKKEIIDTNIQNLSEQRSINTQINTYNLNLSNTKEQKKSLQYEIEQAQKLLSQDPTSQELQNTTTELKKALKIFNESIKNFTKEKNVLQKKKKSLDNQILATASKFKELNEKQKRLLVSLIKFWEKYKKDFEKHKKVYEYSIQQITTNNKKIWEFNSQTSQLSGEIKKYNKQLKSRNSQEKKELFQKRKIVELQLNVFKNQPTLQKKYNGFVDLFDEVLEDWKISEWYLFQFFGNEKAEINLKFKEIQDTLKEITEKKEKLIQLANKKITYLEKLFWKNCSKIKLKNSDTKRIFQYIISERKKLWNFDGNIENYNSSHFENLKEQAVRASIRDIYIYTLMEKEKYWIDSKILDTPIQSFTDTYTTLNKKIWLGKKVDEKSFSFSYSNMRNFINQKEYRVSEVNDFFEESNLILTTLSESLDKKQLEFKSEKLKYIEFIQEKVSLADKIWNNDFLKLFSYLKEYINSLKSPAQLEKLKHTLNISEPKGFFMESLKSLSACAKSIWDLWNSKLKNKYSDIIQHFWELWDIFSIINNSTSSKKDQKFSQEKFIQIQTEIEKKLKQLKNDVKIEKSITATLEQQEEARIIITKIKNKSYTNQSFQEEIDKKMKTYEEDWWLNTTKITKEQYSVVKKIEKEFTALDTIYSNYSSSPEVLDNIVFDILSEKSFKNNPDIILFDVRDFVKNKVEDPRILMTLKDSNTLIQNQTQDILLKIGSEDKEKTKELINILYTKKTDFNNKEVRVPVIQNSYFLEILKECENVEDIKIMLSFYKKHHLKNENFESLSQKLTQNSNLNTKEEEHLNMLFWKNSYERGGAINNKYKIKSLRALILAKEKKFWDSISKNLEKLFLYANKHNKFIDVYSTIMYESHYSLRNMAHSGDVSYIEKKPMSASETLAKEQLWVNEKWDVKRFNTYQWTVYLYSSGEKWKIGAISLDDYMSNLKQQLDKNKVVWRSKKVFQQMNANTQATVSLLNYIGENPNFISTLDPSIAITLIEFIKVQSNKSKWEPEWLKIFKSTLADTSIIDKIEHSKKIVNALALSINAWIDFKEYSKYITDSDAITWSISLKDTWKLNLANTSIDTMSKSEDKEANKAAFKEKENVFWSQWEYIQSLLTSSNSIQQENLIVKDTQTLEKVANLSRNIKILLESFWIKQNKIDTFSWKIMANFLWKETDFSDDTQFLENIKNEFWITLTAEEFREIQNITVYNSYSDKKDKLRSLNFQKKKLKETMDKTSESSPLYATLGEKLKKIELEIENSQTRVKEIEDSIVKNDRYSILWEGITKKREIEEQIIELESSIEKAKRDWDTETEKRLNKELDILEKKLNKQENTTKQQATTEVAKKVFNLAKKQQEKWKISKKNFNEIHKSYIDTLTVYWKILDKDPTRKKEKEEFLKKYKEDISIQNTADTSNSQTILKDWWLYTYKQSESWVSSYISQTPNENWKFETEITFNWKTIKKALSQKEISQMETVPWADKNIFSFYNFFDWVWFPNIWDIKGDLIIALGWNTISTDWIMDEAELFSFSQKILTLIYGKWNPESNVMSLQDAAQRFRDFSEYSVLNTSKKMWLDSMSKFTYMMKNVWITHNTALNFDTEKTKKIANWNWLIAEFEKLTNNNK